MEDITADLAHGIVVDGNIPVLPPGIPRLLHALADDDVNFRDLTHLLEEFPSIAGRLIAVANSAWATPVTPVLSLLDACARLGLSVVRGLAIALSVTAPFNVHRCPNFDPGRFWSTALLTADGAEMFGRFMAQGGDDAPLLRTAGLLHHLGLLWLADRYPAETGRALTEYAETPSVNLARALRGITGTDYCDVGSRLARAWGLPKPLSDVMCFHRDPDYRGEHRDLVRAVGDSARLVRRLYDPSEDNAVICAPPMEPAQCQAVFDRLQQRFDVTVKMASSLFGA